MITTDPGRPRTFDAILMHVAIKIDILREGHLDPSEVPSGALQKLTKFFNKWKHMAPGIEI